MKHLQIDPNHHYREHASTIDIHRALGFIPQFWEESESEHVDTAIVENYQFFNGWNFPLSGEEVKDNKFLYPEDPEQQPLAKYWIDGVDDYALQFPYAIIAICNKDGELIKWTRMD